MEEQDRNLGKRWFEEVWNKGRRDAIAEMLAPDGVLHEGGKDSIGPAGFYPLFDRMHAAMDDIQLTVHETMVDQDRICLRWSFKARHSGDGLGVPASGKTVDVTGITIMRIAGGKLVEGWQNWDMLGLMEQIQEAPRAATYAAS